MEIYKTILILLTIPIFWGAIEILFEFDTFNPGSKANRIMNKIITWDASLYFVGSFIYLLIKQF